MELFYLLLALALLLLLYGGLAVWQLWRRRNLLPYRLADTLLTPAEGQLLDALDAVLGPDHRIFAKVLVEDVIGVERGLPRRAQERAYERLAERRFDFLICEAGGHRVLAAVDLVGDRSGRLRKARPDAALEHICRAAGLPLFTLNAAKRYGPAELSQTLAAIMPVRHASPVESSLDEPQHPDEEHLLASLAAAIRDDTELALPTTPFQTSCRVPEPRGEGG